MVDDRVLYASHMSLFIWELKKAAKISSRRASLVVDWGYDFQLTSLIKDSI